MKNVLLLGLLALLCSCAPIVGEGVYSPQTAASTAPPVPQRFSVLLPDGWEETFRSDIGEAAVVRYEDREHGVKMTVSLLILDSSPIGTLEAEGRNLRRKGWQVHALDGDDSDGMASFVAFSPVRQSIVRAMVPPLCPNALPCVAMFAGSWPSPGGTGPSSVDCEYIQASFRIIPDQKRSTP